MNLKSFSYLLGLLLIVLNSPIWGEEKIDIWDKKKKIDIESSKSERKNIQEKSNLQTSQTIKALKKIQIEDGSTIQLNKEKVYGIYDPANYDFNLNMWSTTKAENLRSSLKRLKKMELSKFSKEILEEILLSFSYPPEGMTDEEFVDIKVNWLIQNDRVDLLESFLKQNDQFNSKSKAVQ